MWENNEAGASEVVSDLSSVVSGSSVTVDNVANELRRSEVAVGTVIADVCVGSGTTGTRDLKTRVPSFQ